MSRLHEQIKRVRHDITRKKRAGEDPSDLQVTLGDLYKIPQKKKRKPKIAIL